MKLYHVEETQLARARSKLLLIYYGIKDILGMILTKEINCEEAGRVLRPIEDEPYYHGFLSRDEVEKIIKKEGEFLVRKTEVGGRHYFVISLKDEGIMKHFLIKRTSKKRLYWVNDYAFKTVSDLIQYHLRNREPLSTSGVFLEKPCPKEEWQLNPEQVRSWLVWRDFYY
ncbi:unnamed protein product [Strongylus vulgaris]|uniref:SH2 domain-containing protein n=1 Tax=Strongylus vulgaris TaxID=40348 RepID=A0A3P7KAL0_STRVU|nr:unnamed protein product [Strongylus vulgaris]